MKIKFRKVLLKALGVFMALSGILCLLFYTQLWNAHVNVSIKDEMRFPLTAQQRVEDFDYLYKTLEESFPYFEVKKRQYAYDWLAQKDAFIKKIEQASNDQEFYSVLSEVLMLLQNGHTNVIPPGREFDEYQSLYSGPHPWSQVYGNTRVASSYDYWETIVTEQENTTIPIAFRYIEGNYYASKNLINPERATDEWGIPIGSQLIRVEGEDVDVYIKNLINRRILRYDTSREKFKLNSFAIRTNSETEITIKLTQGEEITKVLKPYRPDNLGEAGRSLPEHLFSTEILDEGKIAYLRLPSLASSYVDKDREGIRAFLEETRFYPALIIDIRGNGGGSTDYWMDNIVPLLTDKRLSSDSYLLFKDSAYIKPFIKQKMFIGYFGLKPLKELSFSNRNPEFYFGGKDGIFEELDYTIEPSDPVGFKGRILLLVDDYVYSSAESFAVFAKATGWATLVGTRTGGDGIGFDPVPVALPNSGLVVRFPADMGLNPDGSINEEVATLPDIYVEPSYNDFMSQIQAKSQTSEKHSIMDSLPYDTILRKAVELAYEKE